WIHGTLHRAVARSDLHDVRREAEGARSSRAAAQGSLSSLAGLAQDRPDFRAAQGRAALSEIGGGRLIGAARCVRRVCALYMSSLNSFYILPRESSFDARHVHGSARAPE